MRKAILAVLILCISIFAWGCGSAPSANDEKQQEQAQQESTAVETTLGAGEWYVGEDIPAGRYIITSVKGANITVYDDEDSPSDLNEILDTNSKIGVESITYTLKDKQIIKISNGEDVLFTPKE